MPATNLRATCCIAGGGPAGMMLGYLLARAGVDVIVLEKHADFLRDFRGDTVHPSTLRVMDELGLLDEFLELPHVKSYQLEGWIGDMRAQIVDFSHLPAPCNYVAMLPQWDFLRFLAAKGAAFKGFRLLMRTQADSLIEADGGIVGVNASGPDGPLRIGADLVVAADGRHSALRAAAGLKTLDIGAPIDVLWFRLARAPQDGEGLLARVDAGRIIIRLDRGDYWQCAYVIAKGTFDAVRAGGLDAFKADVAALVEIPVERFGDVASFDDVKLLSVAVDRLERWHRKGFLAIGDAAHAMSPVGGVGINLAVQDAVASANQLAAPLRERRMAEADLAAIERRRLLPTRLIQSAQVAAQERIIAPALRRRGPMAAPLPFRLLARFAFLRRLAGRVIGLGFRPEHVRTGTIA